MTTVRSSPPSSCIGALTLALVLIAAGSASAHRLDEYLQAARLAIDPDQVQIALDLTPGLAVAASVLAEIDVDRNGSVSAAEARAYSERLLRAVRLEVDGKPLDLTVVESTFPAVDAVLKGEGTMRVHAVGSMPDLAEGLHQVRYRNSHRSDVGAYLANALVPANDRVTVEAQRRNPDQRDLIVDYTLRADATTRVRQGLSVGITGTLVLLTMLWRRSGAR